MLKIKKKNKDNDVPSILTKKTKGEVVVFAIAFAVFVLYSAILLFSLYYIVLSSFKTGFEYSNIAFEGANPFAFPEVFQFVNYKEAFTLTIQSQYGDEVRLYTMFFNSIWYCGFIICGNALMSSFTGYIMAKYNFKAKEIIFALAIFSMTIPIVGNSASAIKLTTTLRIYNTPFLTLCTSLAGFGFYFMVMYGFFKNISWSYAEAAFIDGASDWTVFFRVMLPQAKMAIMTIAIILFINSWNLYEDPLLFLPSYPTVAAGLQLYKQEVSGKGNMPQYFAGLVVAVVPPIIIYAIFSDRIMKNFSVGGLKG